MLVVFSYKWLCIKMKLTTILMVFIFLISCSTVRPYKDLNCSQINQKQIEIQQQIKEVKNTRQYEHESHRNIIMVPLYMIVFIFAIITSSNVMGEYPSGPQHNKVSDLHSQYDYLQKEAQRKHCPWVKEEHEDGMSRM